MNAWRCEVCGYVHRGDRPPAVCPVCGASREQFTRLEDAAGEPSEVTQETGRPKRWKCLDCGYIHEGLQPPDQCPVCGAPANRFEEIVEEVVVDQSAPAFEVVIVGGGIAGVSAAEAINQASPESNIVLLSQEPQCPYHRLNLTRLLAGEVEEQELWLHPEAWYRAHRIDLRKQIRATAIDPQARQVSLSTGERLSYDKLVLAHGARPFVPPIEGGELERVIALRTLDDTRALLALSRSHRSCVVIGGGLLGLEIAGGLARQGARVKVVEGAPWLLPRQLNETGGRILQQWVEGLGIEVITGTTPSRFLGQRAVEQVALKNGDRLPAELVVAAIGIRPELELVRNAGLATDKGLLVDDYLVTSDPHILAAGDLIQHRDRLYGLWYAAQYQGTIAGLNAVGRQVEFGGLPVSAMLKVLGIGVFSAGEFDAKGDDCQVLEQQQGDAYRRFVLRRRRLIGAILMGDVSQAAKVKTAIEQQLDCRLALTERTSAGELLKFLSEAVG